MMEQEEHELVMACAPSFCRAAFAALTGGETLTHSTLKRETVASTVSDLNSSSTRTVQYKYYEC